jgi:hypothetical protein
MVIQVYMVKESQVEMEEMDHRVLRETLVLLVTPELQEQKVTQ